MHVVYGHVQNLFPGDSKRYHLIRYAYLRYFIFQYQRAPNQKMPPPSPPPKKTKSWVCPLLQAPPTETIFRERAGKSEKNKRMRGKNRNIVQCFLKLDFSFSQKFSFEISLLSYLEISVIGRNTCQSSEKGKYSHSGRKYRTQPLVASRSKVPSGRTQVESSESEFSAIGRPRRIKNCGENLYASLVQSSEEK